jgi:hypothetical protein
MLEILSNRCHKEEQQLQEVRTLVDRQPKYHAETG